MRPDDDYQIDDFVRDQRKQMWFVGGILVLVAIYSALGGALPTRETRSPEPPLNSEVAPLKSASR